MSDEDLETAEKDFKDVKAFAKDLEKDLKGSVKDLKTAVEKDVKDVKGSVNSLSYSTLFLPVGLDSSLSYFLSCSSLFALFCFFVFFPLHVSQLFPMSTLFSLSRCQSV